MLTSAIQTLSKRPRTHRRGESGMTLPMLALSFMTIAGFVGVAVDIARVQLVQSRLSYSLDAAGLAAGSTISSSNYLTEVNKYLRANFPTGYLGTNQPSATVVMSSDNMVMNLVAVVQMPTTFMNAFGIPDVTITSSSQITRTASGLELILSLDVTGSMTSNNKLQALKNASNTLINILFGGRETVKDLWVGIVPFSQTVNIGTSRLSWMDTAYNNTLNWGPTSWMGCVDAHDLNGRDVTDDPPSVQPFRMYYVVSSDNRPAPNNTSSQLNANKWVTSRYADGSPKTYASGIGVTLGPNKFCPSQITPMTGHRSILNAAINNLQARGNTHINLGLAWAWRMISPRWQGFWGGEMDMNGLPLDYNTPLMNKAVILLTDGENVMDNTNYTAYGYLSDGRLGTTSSTTTARNTLDSRMLTMCSALKEQNVYVYTIALGNPGTNIQNKLRQCASGENYYFNSPSSTDLMAIFSAIGDSLSNLRVSQ